VSLLLTAGAISAPLEVTQAATPCPGDPFASRQSPNGLPRTCCRDQPMDAVVQPRTLVARKDGYHHTHFIPCLAKYSLGVANPVRSNAPLIIPARIIP
jgi:hypothetical protein